jgi:AcrR family transcriptional regulator
MSPTRRELVRATRARILDAATRLARERGPDGYSMDVLAKEAGVARATVYEHFRSKRAVLDALAQSAASAVALDAPRPVDGDPLRALRDMLSDVCRHWSAHEVEMRELQRICALTGTNHIGNAIDGDTLRSLVDELARAGQLRTVWSRDEAVDALAVLTSFATYEQLREDRAPDQVEGVLAKLAVSIIAPGTSGSPNPVG